MKKTLLALAVCMGLCSQTQAQDKNILNHLGAGIEVGTTGIGFEVATPVTDYLQVRAGLAIMPTIKIKTFNVDVNLTDAQGNNMWEEAKANYQEMLELKPFLKPEDQANMDLVNEKGWVNLDAPNQVDIESKAKIGANFKFLIDFFPIKTSSFHITAGFYAGKSQVFDAYTVGNEGQFEALTFFDDNYAGKTISTEGLPGGEKTFNFPDPISVTIGGEDKGENTFYPNGRQMVGYTKVKGFKPYVGIGFGRAIPKKTRLAFACDLGVQFWSTPKLFIEQKDGPKQVITDGISDDNGGDIVKTISKITVYPCLNFRLTGRIF